MKKTVINANECKFEIREMANGSGFGIFMNHDEWTEERLLFTGWTVSECKTFIFSNFIGEKGTKFDVIFK